MVYNTTLWQYLPLVYTILHLPQNARVVLAGSLGDLYHETHSNNSTKQVGSANSGIGQPKDACISGHGCLPGFKPIDKLEKAFPESWFPTFLIILPDLRKKIEYYDDHEKKELSLNLYGPWKGNLNDLKNILFV